MRRIRLLSLILIFSLSSICYSFATEYNVSLSNGISGKSTYKTTDSNYSAKISLGTTLSYFQWLDFSVEAGTKSLMHTYTPGSFTLSIPISSQSASGDMSIGYSIRTDDVKVKTLASVKKIAGIIKTKGPFHYTWDQANSYFFRVPKLDDKNDVNGNTETYIRLSFGSTCTLTSLKNKLVMNYNLDNVSYDTFDGESGDLDVNGDGVIDINDVQLVWSLCNDSTYIPSNVTEAGMTLRADINEDFVWNEADIGLILEEL